MKKIILFLLFVNVLKIGFSQVFTINDKEVFDFLDEYKDNGQINSKFSYLWSGTIIDIKDNNGLTEIKIVKSRWIDKSELQSVIIVLKTNNKGITEKIKKIGLNTKILFICAVLSVTEDEEIICSPELIKEI